MLFENPTNNPYITCVGSRKTPQPILELMEEIGCWLVNHGFIIRSGSAQGADEYFERGVLRSDHPTAMEIFLPWKGFGKLTGDLGCYHNVKTYHNHADAIAMAQAVIPHWDNCGYGAKMLHGRNPYQVLGHDLNTKSQALIYYAEYTTDGELKGGTRTAVVIAERHCIPTFNLYHPFVCALFKQAMGLKGNSE